MPLNANSIKRRLSRLELYIGVLEQQQATAIDLFVDGNRALDREKSCSILTEDAMTAIGGTEVELDRRGENLEQALKGGHL